MWICWEDLHMTLSCYAFSFKMSSIFIQLLFYLMQIDNTGNIQAWFWPPVGYCCLARLKELKSSDNKSHTEIQIQSNFKRK